MASVRGLGPGGGPPYKVTIKRGGERWYFTRDTKPQADRVAGLAEDDLDHGRDPYERYEVVRAGATGMTLRQWSVVWLAAQDVEESWRVRLQGYLDRDILPAFGGCILQDGMSRIAVRAWLTGLATKKRKRTGKPLAPASISNLWSTLARLTADAVAEGILDRDPCVGLRPPKVPQRRGERHVLTPVQVVAVAVVLLRPRPQCKGEPRVSLVQRRWWLLTLVLAWSGCRWSELGGLRSDPGEVRLMRRPAPAIVVTEPMKTTGRKDGRYHGEPKSEAGGRDVELIQPLADEIAAFMAHGLPYVFGTGAGTAHHYEDYRLAFKAAVGELGHPEWTVHDLRHSHATWIKRCDRLAVRERLGHEPQDVTDVYTHVGAEDRAEILLVLLALWDEAHGLTVSDEATGS